MRIIVLTALILLLATMPLSAEIYKWVDDNGNVHFTDTPPPGHTDSEVVNPQPNVVAGYGTVSGESSAQAAPAQTPRAGVAPVDLPIVELFVTSWCGYCKKAEAWFKARNIPYVKYDVEKDRDAARRKASLTQSRGVPFVLIGSVGIPGYSEAAFEKALRQYQ